MQKKVLLSAINAKYIHSNLAVRYLKEYCRNKIEEVNISEFSINDNIGSILKKLYRSGADIFGFSCYIWNISLVIDLCSSLKKAKPDAVIILGGPEVSYDPTGILIENPSVDYIVAGEGELTFLELLEHILYGKGSLSNISGIGFRNNDGVVVTTPRPLLPSLDQLPFPYGSLEGFENKIVYYETSRGCPFNCQYCLSSTIHGVRYLSMDRLREDIKAFTDAGLRQVKLVDRTFNCDINRSIEIMQLIIDLNPATNFHFEIAADLINERFLDTVKKAPRGMFQFEIGVQSTNPKTLSEIKRVMDFEKVKENVEKLMSFGNSHIHLDLIAGLPYEDLKSFEKSFDDVYALHSDMLQLGFLKLLKGSGIRNRAEDYGMEHHDFPPYEVIKTDWLSFNDLLVLKDIEHVLEQYHNSGRFKHTLDFLFRILGVTPFSFYRRLSEYWGNMGHFSSSKSLNELYTILHQHISESYPDALDTERSCLLNEYLKLDWLLYVRSGNMPRAINRYDHSIIKERVHQYMKTTLPEVEGFYTLKKLSMREILKQIGYEVFERNIFDSSPEEGRFLMFYPLRQDSPGLMPDLYIIPLDEI